MREIKFRAFYSPDVENNETGRMVYDVDRNRNNGYALGIFMQDLLVFGPGSVKIMQYTGLKDKNGKDVYEGDVILNKLATAPEDRGWLVSWIDNGFYYTLIDFEHEPNEKFVPFDETAERFEIIGNIYEHKHLLE